MHRDDHQGPTTTAWKEPATVRPAIQKIESNAPGHMDVKKGTEDQPAQDPAELFREKTSTEEAGHHQDDVPVNKLKSWMFTRTVMLNIMNQTFNLMDTTQSCLGNNFNLRNPD